MKGKINSEGKLLIKRVLYDPVYCPIGAVFTCCGDDCALFGEPELVPMNHGWDDMGRCKTDPEYIGLELCHKTLRFTEFKDERNHKE